MSLGILSFKNLSQGSSKLEKAEILQMTVDHLKMLHAAGGKGVVTYELFVNAQCPLTV